MAPSFKSAKKQQTKDVAKPSNGTFARDVSANLAIGTTSGTTAAIVSEAAEIVANKVLPGSGPFVDFAIDAAGAVALGEGLEATRDGEKLFNEDWAEDALVAVASNTVGAIVAVGILGTLGLPALATAAIGIGVSAVVGAAYSASTSNKNRFALPDSTQPGGGDSTGQREVNSGSEGTGRSAHGGNRGGTGGEILEFGPLYITGDSDGGSDAGTEGRSANPNSTQQQDNAETHWRRDNGGSDGLIMYENGSERGHFEREYNENGEETGGYRKVTFVQEVDEDGNKTGNFLKTTTTTDENGETTTKQEVVRAKDSDGDGVPDQNDAAPNDKDAWSPNPMNDSQVDSQARDKYGARVSGLLNASGQSVSKYDYIRGFSGEIDNGPDGNYGHGDLGRYDVLTGLDPRIDYGQDGKPGQGYQGEHDNLVNFDGTIDWGDNHSGDHEFSGNILTDILGDINPRSNGFDLASHDLASMLVPTDPLLV